MIPVIPFLSFEDMSDIVYNHRGIPVGFDKN
jgi:hypothetical protein